MPRRPMSSMPTVVTTARPSPGPTRLSSTASYVLTCLAGFVCALVCVAILWFLVQCYRRGRKGQRSKEQWIPFRPSESLSGRPSVRRVQPVTAKTSVWADVKTKMLEGRNGDVPRLSYVEGLQPSGVGMNNRRQSVPVLPSVHNAHAVSAMDFTKRRFSIVPDTQDGGGSSTDQEGGTDIARRASSTKSRRRSSTCPEPGEVNRQMYGFGPEAALNAHGLGKLCFSLAYNREMELLYVKIHRATYLSVLKRAKEYGHFHVKVSLLMTDCDDDIQIHKTNVVRSIRNPIFEQEFSFNAQAQHLKSSAVLFVVRERRQTELGSVMFPLRDVDLLEDENSNLHSIWRDISRHGTLNEPFGEIYLSLSFNPQTSKLCVGLVKCRNLNVNSQETAIFCRVTVMTAEKVLKDERSRVLKKDLNSPTIEQDVVFTIDKSLLNNVCLSVTIWGKRNLGFNTLLGKSVLGPMTYSDGEGLLHWSTMMHEPKKTVHQWHTLR